MNGNAMLEAVEKYLDKEGFHYEYNPKLNAIGVGFYIENKIKDTRVFIEFKDHGYLVLATIPQKANTALMSELLKFLSLVNFNLTCGHFEVSVNGDIRYKVWVGTDGLNKLPKEIVEQSVRIPCGMLESFGDAIVTLATGLSDAMTELKKLARPLTD